MTKLCPRGKAAAKRKFKVYPSAYANAYASKICAGKAKDPSGVKRKDWGPKKANTGAYIGLKNKRQQLRNLEPPVKTPMMRVKNKAGDNARKQYQQKLKQYEKLKLQKEAQNNTRPMPKKKFKKGGALMIIIGVGKKKKVDKKMGGGMTAGSMSGMGRLQKARMMNKGGESKAAPNKPTPNPGPPPKSSPKSPKISLEEAREFRKKAKQRKQRKGFELKYPGPARPGNPVVAYEVKKGGLTSELNNPAKGYTKGGMADYYKDLM